MDRWSIVRVAVCARTLMSATHPRQHRQQPRPRRCSSSSSSLQIEPEYLLLPSSSPNTDYCQAAAHLWAAEVAPHPRNLHQRVAFKVGVKVLRRRRRRAARGEGVRHEGAGSGGVRCRLECSERPPCSHAGSQRCPATCKLRVAPARCLPFPPLPLPRYLLNPLQLPPDRPSCLQPPATRHPRCLGVPHNSPSQLPAQSSLPVTSLPHQYVARLLHVVQLLQQLLTKLIHNQLGVAAQAAQRPEGGREAR